MTTAVIGNGWVGKSMMQLFPDSYLYSHGIGTQEEVNKRDVAFICVPTPCPAQWKLDTSIVEECISWCTCPLIVIRSTVNPGDCYIWIKKYDKKLIMQPEYLGETVAHPMSDAKTRPFLIIGGFPDDRRKLIELYHTVYNANITIRQVTHKEAEIIKLTENRAIAFKVAQCQELYDACQGNDVDYYTIRDAVFGDDPRFNLWFTFVYPDKRGFKSKCIPKDIYAWIAWAYGGKCDANITRALLKQNEVWTSAL